MDEKTLKIESTRRLGQPKADMSRPRPLLIRFATEWDARKCLSKSYRLKNYHERIFISQSLNKEDQATKRKLLQKRYGFNYSDLTQNIGRIVKIDKINNFAVTISITTIQGSHLFLLINNPPSTSPYRIEANLLADWISSCYAKFEINYLSSFSIVGDL